MADIIVLIILTSLFGGRGFILFVFYLLFKYYLPKIIQRLNQQGYGKIIDIDKIKSGFSSVKDKIRAAKIKEAFTTHSTPYSSHSSPSSFNLPKMTFPKFKISIGLIFAIIVILVIMDGFTSIPAGQVGVIYDRGRGVLEESLPPGLHLKIPFWQVITKMDTRLQAYTMSIAPDEGEFYGDDSIESLTKDGQKVYVDVTIQFRLESKDAPWIYQQVGTDYRAKVIRPGVRNVVRDIITGYDSTKLFTQETRVEAQEKMAEELGDLYAVNRLKLEDILLRNISFSDIYLQSIEDKQVAQQRIQKAEYEKQEAVIIKEKKIIEAQAEAEAIRLKGETLRNNPQVIQFEFVQKMADDISWGILPDGILPLLNLGNIR